MSIEVMQIHVDSARIIHENIDNETLIIDAETGIYYVLRGSGAEIWELISQGMDLAALTDQLAQRYAMSAEQLQPALQSFLDDLQKVQLITLHASQLPHAPVAIGTLPPQRAAESTFTPPELHIFNDMHDLLLIDPIHEVTESGWPFTASQQN